MTTTETPGELLGYYWNADRTALSIRVRYPQGVNTMTYHWADPETAAKYAEQALEIAATRDLSQVVARLGQKHATRRVATPVGVLYLGHVSGPPTWWLPRFGLRFGNGFRLRAGWLRHGFSIHLKARER